MEYKASLPEANDNVSHDKPVREFFLLFIGITLFFLIIFWSIGLFVDQAVNFISPEVEASIFSSIGKKFEPKTTDDPQEIALQHLLDSLRKCSDITYPVRVYLMESDEANAMAVPGGRIIVFSALLDEVTSENGLAFVLAHELGHFKNRDHLRGMGRSIVLTAILAALTGSDSDITKVFTPSLNLSFSQYSQARESLADASALQTLNCYYGHVGGASEFFEAITPIEKSSHTKVTQYFASHPMAIERINGLWQQAKEHHFKQGEVAPLPIALRHTK